MKNNLEIVYRLTYLIEPPNLGMLVIEDIVVSESQYNAIKGKLQTPMSIKPIEMGDTKNNGVVFGTYLSSSSLLDTYIDAILALANDIVTVGVSYDNGQQPTPRIDLSPCLSNSKVYILNDKIKKPKCLSKYFSSDEIIYPSTDKLLGKLKNIKVANELNLKDTEEDSSYGYINNDK